MIISENPLERIASVELNKRLGASLLLVHAAGAFTVIPTVNRKERTATNF
jgi:hypothetical protein